MKEYIFLIGSAKSGTTKLADMLDMHPSISLSKPKESDFFGDKVFSSQTQSWYESLFTDDPVTSSFRLDASTSYSAGWGEAGARTAERIAEFSPDAQLIYLVRNPVSRSWSSYWHSVRAGSEKRTPKDALSDTNYHHIQASLYKERLDEYAHHFPHENIHVVYFEEFVKAPELFANKLIQRFGLPTVDFDALAPAETVNSSYQWSGPFKYLSKLSSGKLASINELVKKLLPPTVHSMLKNAVSKPIPDIDDISRQLIEGQIKEDYQRFIELYGNSRVKLD